MFNGSSLSVGEDEKVPEMVSADVGTAVRCADDTTPMAESEEELKSLLMKVKVGSEKVGLKLNI